MMMMMIWPDVKRIHIYIIYDEPHILHTHLKRRWPHLNKTHSVCLCVIIIILKVESWIYIKWMNEWMNLAALKTNDEWMNRQINKIYMCVSHSMIHWNITQTHTHTGLVRIERILNLQNERIKTIINRFRHYGTTSSI